MPLTRLEIKIVQEMTEDRYNPYTTTDEYAVMVLARHIGLAASALLKEDRAAFRHALLHLGAITIQVIQKIDCAEADAKRR